MRCQSLFLKSLVAPIHGISSSYDPQMEGIMAPRRRNLRPNLLGDGTSAVTNQIFRVIRDFRNKLSDARIRGHEVVTKTPGAVAIHGLLRPFGRDMTASRARDTRTPPPCRTREFGCEGRVVE